MTLASTRPKSTTEVLFHYREFPYIENISDVLSAIDGRNEFVIRDRGWYKSVDYTYALPKSFPVAGEPLWDILRECRGLIFDSQTGAILSRPYHKVRNYMESPESHGLRDDDFAVANWLEKLDGSMVRPLLCPDGEVRFATRAGLTDVAAQVDEWVKDRPWYMAFCKSIMDIMTPIFEWCSRSNRVVIDHPTSRLVLTAIRHNRTGRYVPLELMAGSAYVCGGGVIEVIGVLPGLDDSPSKRLEQIRYLQGHEGVVVRWDCGEMVKVKAEDYVRLHRTKALGGRERDLLELIKTGKLDDLKPLLSPDHLRLVEVYEWEVTSGMVRRAKEWLEICTEARTFLDKRSLAVDFVANLPESRWSRIVFAAAKLDWNIPDHYSFLWQFIKTTCQAGVDESRWLHGATWTFESDSEAFQSGEVEPS